MWSRNVAIIVAFFLALAPVIAADAFDLELTAREEVVVPGQAALFDLAVTNKLDVTDRYTISSQDFSFILSIDPRPAQILPNGTGVFGIELMPRNFVSYGNKVAPIRVRSALTGESEEIEPLIVVRDPERTPGVYLPSIALSVSAPDQVDPREDLVMNIHLRNRNARVYDQQDPVTVEISSDIFFERFNIQLGGVGDLGEKTPEQRIDLDPYQAPGTFTSTVKVIVQNQTVSEAEKGFEVVPYSNIERRSSSDSSWFRYQTTYTVFNDGNVDQPVTIEHDSSFAQRIFSGASDNYVFEDGALVFSEELSSQEEFSVIVTENYRLLVVLILVLLLSIIGWYVLRSPLVLEKGAHMKGSKSEGSSEIKVRLYIKNRSSQTLRNLRVIDRVSGVAEVVKEQTLGTIKPTKVVKKKGQGMLLRWDLEQLDPFEERIISYRVKMPLKLVGDVSLPSMKVKFDVQSGRERTTHSNEVTIMRHE